MGDTALFLPFVLLETILLEIVMIWKNTYWTDQFEEHFEFTNSTAGRRQGDDE